MTWKAYFLLFCGISLNQLLFVSAQSDDVIVCNVTNPSPDNICTLEFNPVCAWYFVCVDEESCKGFTAGNPCEACKQRGFDYYTLGPCEGDGNVNEEESSEEEQPAENTEEGGGEEEGPSEENTEGGQGIIWCNVPNLLPADVVCTLEYDPVCAYHASEEDSEGVTVGNTCQACLQQGFDYYTPGACENGGNEETGGEEEGDFEENNNGIILCDIPDLLETETEIACTLQYDPVCAYRAGEEDSQGVTVGNSCQACYQQGFDYYTRGPCENVGEEELVIIVEPPSSA